MPFVGGSFALVGLVPLRCHHSNRLDCAGLLHQPMASCLEATVFWRVPSHIDTRRQVPACEGLFIPPEDLYQAWLLCAE